MGLLLPLVYIFGALIALAGTTEGAAVAKVCEIPINSKELYRLQWPLVFTPEGDLYDVHFAPDKALLVKVSDGASVLLSCGPNYLKKYYKTEVLTATCNGQTGNFSLNAKDTNIVDGTELSIKDLTCDLRVIEEVLSPVAGCPDDKFSSTNFGYVDPLEKVSVVVGESCYDTEAGRTLWAHVKLGQKASSYLLKTEKSFLSGHNQHPDGRYKIDLFRGLYFDEIYERMRSKLHTKEIPSLRITNYVNEPLLNSVQFQAVKKLGWNYFVTHDDLHVFEALKADIQRLAKQRDLDIYVGGHGVHTVHGPNGEKMDVYLHVATKDDGIDRFPMPDLIWMIVKHKDKAIAFGVINDDNVTEEEVTKRALCSDICENVTWLVDSKKSELNRTPLICCSYQELKNSIKDLPLLEGINDVLL